MIRVLHILAGWAMLEIPHAIHDLVSYYYFPYYIVLYRGTICITTNY